MKIKKVYADALTTLAKGTDADLQVESQTS